MTKLEDGEVRTFLEDLDGWKHFGNAIHKEFTFPGFRGSIAFVNRVAEEANTAGHHPDIEVHYNRVLISLSTHDEGGVTERDVALAAQIDGVTEPDGS